MTPSTCELIFVAAFALDEGESFAEIFAQFGDTPLLSAVRPRTYASDRTRRLGAGQSPVCVLMPGVHAQVPEMPALALIHWTRMPR